MRGPLQASRRHSPHTPLDRPPNTVVSPLACMGNTEAAGVANVGEDDLVAAVAAVLLGGDQCHDAVVELSQPFYWCPTVHPKVRAMGRWFREDSSGTWQGFWAMVHSAAWLQTHLGLAPRDIVSGTTPSSSSSSVSVSSPGVGVCE
mmetsp:Transcript_21671/g.64693  ORF Transcript_21671/g.64693 Transcript_21671/m.64693 type:complete len:146 (-) Transcript_21671:818-1255(-)